MMRTQVQLTDEQAELLKRRAGREKRSMADLVRQALDQQLRAEPGPARAELRRRARAAVGRFASGQRDVAERHDHYLVDAFDGEDAP